MILNKNPIAAILVKIRNLLNLPLTLFLTIKYSKIVPNKKKAIKGNKKKLPTSNSLSVETKKILIINIKMATKLRKTIGITSSF